MNHNKKAYVKPTGRVVLVLLLTAGYMVAEAVGGYLSNSLALLADAGHMLADVAALSISLFAFAISAKPADEKATFGYHRAEILAALFNGLVLILVSFFIIKEAIGRLFNPSVVETNTMMLVALGGLVINLISLGILHKDSGSNINIKGAWLHVMSDTLGSVGVIISGLLIYFFGWHISDPLASIAISSLISYSAVHLIFDTVKVLMEQVPGHLCHQTITEEILSISEVSRVHDLHIWSISSGRDALSVHVVAEAEADYNKLLHDVQQLLTLKFGIEHATIQIEGICPAPRGVC